MLFTATGIQANRVFSYADDPEKKDPEIKKQWLETRRSGIGGSDIAAIIGLNPWKTPLQVFLDKKGKSEQVESNEKMKWGNVLEPVVAKEFAERTESNIVRINYLLADKTHDYMMADIDRLIIETKDIIKEDMGNGILEIKTTGWGEAWEDGNIPETAYCQVQWYLGITGLKWAKVAALVRGQELIIPEIIWRSDETIKALQDMATMFWKEHIIKDQIPTPQSAEDFSYMAGELGVVQQKRFFGKELQDLVKKKLEIQERIKKDETDIAKLNGKILEIVGPYKTCITDETQTTRVSFTKNSFSTEQFKIDHPELYVKYLKESQVNYFKHTLKKNFTEI